MEIAAFFLAIGFVFCMGFLGGGLGRLGGELLIQRVLRQKPLPRAAAILIRLLGWALGCGLAGVVSWREFWRGMSGDGSKLTFAGVPSQEWWLAAFVLGLVLLWLASWWARRSPR